LANIKSQIKRNRQNDKRRLRNRVYRGQTRTAVKDARVVIESQDTEAAKKALLEAISTLDKAAEKGVIHKNNAARRKSRLMKQFNKMEPVQPAAETNEAAPVAEEPKATPRKRAAKKAEAK
jgi:small subunit ribosomal protein S20